MVTRPLTKYDWNDRPNMAQRHCPATLNSMSFNMALLFGRTCARMWLSFAIMQNKSNQSKHMVRWCKSTSWLGEILVKFHLPPHSRRFLAPHLPTWLRRPCDTSLALAALAPAFPPALVEALHAPRKGHGAHGAHPPTFSPTFGPRPRQGAPDKYPLVMSK